jgi:hypothetical protein
MMAAKGKLKHPQLRRLYIGEVVGCVCPVDAHTPTSGPTKTKVL